VAEDKIYISLASWMRRAASLPFLLVLVILEPVVTFVLTALTLLGVLTTLFFRLVGPPGFPAWTMLTLSLSLAFVLMVYHALIRILSES
jgi:hypothetical protein